MNGSSEPPPHRCWVVIPHIVAAVQYTAKTNPAMKAQMTADGKIKVRLSEFEDGCGMSKQICTQLFKRGNMQLRKRLENEGVLLFCNSHQVYELKEIIISTGDIKSMVPYWFLALGAEGLAVGLAKEGRVSAEEGRVSAEEGRVSAEEGLAREIWGGHSQVCKTIFPCTRHTYLLIRQLARQPQQRSTGVECMREDGREG